MPQKKAKKDQYEWEVEKVIDRRLEPDGSFRYLTKWKNCPSSENSWEPRSSFGSDAWKVEELEKILDGEVKKPKWRINFEKSLKAANEKPVKAPEKTKRGRPSKTTPPKSPAIVKSTPVASPAFHLLVRQSIPAPVVAPRRQTQNGDGLDTVAATTPRKSSRNSAGTAGVCTMCPHHGTSSDGPMTSGAAARPDSGTNVIDPHLTHRQSIPLPSQGLQIAIASGRGEVVVAPIGQVSPKPHHRPVSRRTGEETEHREELLRGIEGGEDMGLLEESPSSPEVNGRTMEDQEIEKIELDEATLSMSSLQTPSVSSNEPSLNGFIESQLVPTEIPVMTYQPSPSITNGPSTSGITQPRRVDPTMISPSDSLDAHPVEHTNPKKVKDVKHSPPVITFPTMVGKPPMNSIRKIHSTPKDKKRAHVDSTDPDYIETEESRSNVHKRAPRRVASAVVLPAAMDSEDEEERGLKASGQRVALTKVSFDGYPKSVLSLDTGSHSAFFNTECAVGPNCYRSLFSALPKQIEGLRLTQLWQSVLIRLVESSREQKALMEAVIDRQGESKQYPSVTATFAWGGCSRTIFLAPPSDLQEANNNISAILAKVGMCSNAIRFGTRMSCSRCVQD